MTNLADLSIEARLQATLDQQRQAWMAHPAPPYAERLSSLKALERFVRENRDDLIAAVSADYGHRSPHETMMTEIGPVLAGIRHARKHLRGWMKPQNRKIDRVAFGLASNTVIPQPLGVVGVIVPWNFPINLSLIPLTYVFAAGNPAMVKMSENSRHLAALMQERLPQYFDADKLAVFDETGGVGLAFSQLPFDHLLFTGSSQTGRAVMAAAAKNLCPVTLELGGRSPAIVADDFDLRTAAERILFTKYLNAGQVCTTVDHVYLPEAKVAEFVALAHEIVPQRYASIDSIDYTSVIDQRAYKRLKAALADAKAKGATVQCLLPGKAFDDAKHRIAPHLVFNAPADCQLLQHEIFGPILPVVAYQSIDEVIKRINAGPRPLAIYPFSKSKATVDKLITHVMSGGVSVNDALLHVGQDDLPFGGVGDSGMGHYHGHEGFLTFSKLRPVFKQARWSSVSLLFPPYGPVADRLLKFLTR